jgi:hypothetical protein
VVVADEGVEVATVKDVIGFWFAPIVTDAVCCAAL